MLQGDLIIAYSIANYGLDMLIRTTLGMAYVVVTHIADSTLRYVYRCWQTRSIVNNIFPMLYTQERLIRCMSWAPQLVTGANPTWISEKRVFEATKTIGCEKEPHKWNQIRFSPLSIFVAWHEANFGWALVLTAPRIPPLRTQSLG